MIAPRWRSLAVRRPLDVAATLGSLRRGAGDPCTRLAPGHAWRATRTPDGPATLHLRHQGDRVEAEAWGPGAGWALDATPALLGEHDDEAGFVAHHPVVVELRRRFPGLRIGRTLAVSEALVPTIIEQKVTGHEARRSWRRLVAQLGEPAPGPGGLRLPPAPDALAAAPPWLFHRLDLERRRADTIRRACSRSTRLDEAAALPLADAYRRLQALPGVGPWSAAEVAMVALGDADAVSVGDYHLPHQVSWAFAGERRGSDERMLELLEPYRGHRGRVLRLLTLGGVFPPRRGPRLAPRTIAGW